MTLRPFTLNPRVLRTLLPALILLGVTGCRSVGPSSSWELLTAGNDMGSRGLERTVSLLDRGTGWDDVRRTADLFQNGPKGSFGTVASDARTFVEPFSWASMRSTFRHLR